MKEKTYTRIPISKRDSYKHELRLFSSIFNDKQYYHIREFYRKEDNEEWKPGLGWSLSRDHLLDLAWGLELMLVFEDQDTMVYNLLSDEVAERLRSEIESQEEIDYKKVAENILPTVVSAGGFMSQIKEARKHVK